MFKHQHARQPVQDETYNMSIMSNYLHVSLNLCTMLSNYLHVSYVLAITYVKLLQIDLLKMFPHFGEV